MIDLQDERTFQTMVVEVARLHGWRVAHFPSSLSVRGRHMTATAYDARGFPDLVLVHPERGLMLRELKRESGRLSDTQIAWLQALDASGADAGVWRPSDWPRILVELGATERGPNEIPRMGLIDRAPSSPVDSSGSKGGNTAA